MIRRQCGPDRDRNRYAAAGNNSDEASVFLTLEEPKNRPKSGVIVSMREGADEEVSAQDAFNQREVFQLSSHQPKIAKSQYLPASRGFAPPRYLNSHPA
jgi:hypothetical protein